MNIYLIEISEYGYDCNSGFVVAARNESEVRNMASDKASDEGKRVWLNEAKVTKVGFASSDIAKPKIILRSFHAG